MEDLTIIVVDTDKIKLDHVNIPVQGHDMTIIMEKIYVSKDGRLELSSEKLIGWYRGKPNETSYLKWYHD